MADYIFPRYVACKRKVGLDSDLFKLGNAERQIWSDKLFSYFPDENIETLYTHQTFYISCPFAGCNVSFSSPLDFDSHYTAYHSSSCSVCRKTFPSTRLMHLHFGENHDSFFQAKVARGFPMYECLVEGCNSKFKSSDSRQKHLIMLHKFPKSFSFSKSKRQPSKKRRKKKKQANPKSVSHSIVEESSESKTVDSGDQVKTESISSFKEHELPYNSNSKDDVQMSEMDDLSMKFSLLATVSSESVKIPHNISFGRRRVRGTFPHKS